MVVRMATKPVPILAILVVAMLAVGLACAGEKATPTSAPTSAPTATTKPTATTAPPTPTLAAGETPQATATPVSLTYVEQLMQHPGYHPEWGEPQYGGTLKMRHPWTSSSFNPDNPSVFHAGHGPPMSTSLVRFDPWVGMSSIIPEAAKSWEFSEDLLHLTFHLVEGAEYYWHDALPESLKGAVFTCEDVQASTEYYVRPPASEPKVVHGKLSLSHVNSVSCPDGPLGYTAVFNLDKYKDATIPQIAVGAPNMFDKDWLAWYNAEHPGELGTATPASFKLAMTLGAWYPKEYIPDIVVKYGKNPNYWRAPLPFTDEFQLVILKDFNTAFTALATGQVHIFGACSGTLQPGQVQQAVRDFPDKIIVSPILHGMGQGGHYQTAVAPFDDVRVRWAMNLALDRQGWNDFKSVAGYRLFRYSGYMVPQMPLSPSEEEVLTYPGVRPDKAADIAEANRLLDEVFGAGKRFKATVTISNQANYIDIVLYTADVLKKSTGINLDMEVLEPAVSSQRGAAGNFQMGASTAGLATMVGDPDDSFLRFHKDYTTPSTVLRLAGDAAARPEFTAELEADMMAVSNEVDPVRRKELVKALDRKMWEEANYSLILGWNVLAYGSVPNLGGWHMYDTAVVSGHGLWERLWIKKR